MRTIQRLIYGLWLPLLCAYIGLGLPITPFHADEADHLQMAQDYVSYFVLGDPARLAVSPPLAIDSPQHVRLLVGTLTAYTSGFILWHSRATTLENWPSGWYYPHTMAENRAAGRYPTLAVLQWGRLAPTLFLMAGAWCAYALGHRLQGPLAGATVALVYALQPALLLNGRRVMQEGALMFGLLAVLLAGMWVAEQPTRARWGWFGLACGLALTAKPSALIGISGVAVGLIWATWSHWRDLWPHALSAILAGGLVFVALTPAIWDNPPARLMLAAHLRAEVLAGQTAASSDAHQGLADRVGAVWRNPFTNRLQYYESPDFAEDADLQTAIRHYDGHPLRGVALPVLVGWPLLLMGLAIPAPHAPARRVFLAWVVLSGAAVGLAVPLDWARYYLPWTLAATLAAGLGLDILRQTLQDVGHAHSQTAKVTP